MMDSPLHPWEEPIFPVVELVEKPMDNSDQTVIAVVDDDLELGSLIGEYLNRMVWLVSYTSRAKDSWNRIILPWSPRS